MCTGLSSLNVSQKEKPTLSHKMICSLELAQPMLHKKINN